MRVDILTGPSLGPEGEIVMCEAKRLFENAGIVEQSLRTGGDQAHG